MTKKKAKKLARRPAKVLKTAHIPGPRRKPKFAAPKVRPFRFPDSATGDNLVEVGLPEELESTIAEDVEANASEDSAGPKARAEDEAEVTVFEKPMKYGDVDG